ncbi:MetQ/NlpA family ABC transporter substrate-binding protein [Clostridium sp. Marseille-P299]|uniref:MetQ/NlpA family ABC transporter substrate-binding protein n=1 Tax=Clostridium sp. Marseille-P299 TaxID=1805477 RepID=UPI000834D9EF|nr:MetQ/NlpA family ABC transporter substrate-binding protein [Clostridium sp. Marseille-P299]
MKKSLFVKGLAVVLSISLLTGCGLKSNDAGKSTEDSKKIVVGASPAPHAEILKKAAELLKDKGYELEIIEFTDYVQPNIALNNGDIDANYFQHQPYLDKFNKEQSADLVAAGVIHYEPFGLYPGKTATIDQLADKAQIAVPNDSSNEARALILLEAQGLIKLKEGVGFEATVKDIAENPKNLEILEIAAEQLPRSLQDVDMAVINGNYAIDAGLDVKTDAIAIEDEDSISAKTYGNILAVKDGNQDKESIKALVEVLKSDEIRTFIEETYNGAVVPMK